MKQIDQYVGDAQARLTVSGSLSSVKEFHKAESFVSITVTCNNNMDDIMEVHDIVKPVVHQLASEDLEEISKFRDELIAPVSYQTPRVEKDESKIVPSRPPVTGKVGINKPQFKR